MGLARLSSRREWVMREFRWLIKFVRPWDLNLAGLPLMVIVLWRCRLGIIRVTCGGSVAFAYVSCPRVTHRFFID